MRSPNIALAAFILAALLLKGCGGPVVYKADLPNNFAINPKTESVTASLAIYSVDSDCKTTYQGSVELENQRIELGIATGKPAYLVVNFTSSSFWRSSTGSISSDSIIVPRDGCHYLINVSYADGIYNVGYYEVDYKTKETRELETVSLISCRDL